MNDKVTAFKEESWTRSFTIVADNYTQGGLVGGGIVTADSVYGGTDPYLAVGGNNYFGPSGLINGNFRTGTNENPDNRVAKNANTSTTAWFNIAMSEKPCVVRSVIIISFE